MKNKFGPNLIINATSFTIAAIETFYRVFSDSTLPITYITIKKSLITPSIILPIMIELAVLFLSMLALHERGHCFSARRINPASNPKFVNFMEMDCDWSVFQESEVVKIAIAGPLSSISTQLFAAIILTRYFKIAPVTLIVGILAELTNFTIYRLSSGSFTDGTWLKYPQVRKHFTTEQIKAAASLQELLGKIKE